METAFLFTTVMLFMIGVMHSTAVDSNSEFAYVLDSYIGDYGRNREHHS